MLPLEATHRALVSRAMCEPSVEGATPGWGRRAFVLAPAGACGALVWLPDLGHVTSPPRTLDSLLQRSHPTGCPWESHREKYKKSCD